MCFDFLFGRFGEGHVGGTLTVSKPLVCFEPYDGLTKSSSIELDTIVV
jgi:hypothetical protein